MRIIKGPQPKFMNFTWTCAGCKAVLCADKEEDFVVQESSEWGSESTVRVTCPCCGWQQHVGYA